MSAAKHCGAWILAARSSGIAGDDQIYLAHRFHHFSSALPTAWEHPAITCPDLGYLSGFRRQDPMSFQQMAKLRDIQVELELPGLTLLATMNLMS